MDGLRVEENEHGMALRAQVDWVNAEEVEREIEIKAVTTHGLVVKEVAKGEVITSSGEDVPDFEGPGWYADVVFDI